MGAFDDLIPGGNPPGAFDDLIPKQGAFSKAVDIYNDPDGGILPAAGSLLVNGLPKGVPDQGWLGNAAIDLARAPVSASQTLAGLANLATAGGAGKILDAVGYRPQDAQAALSDHYGDSRKAANQEVVDASADAEKGYADAHGAWDTTKSLVSGAGGIAGAMLRNPGTIQDQVIQSAPDMLMGAGLVGGAASAVFKKAALTVGVDAARVAELVAGSPAKNALEQKALQLGTEAVDAASNKLSWLGHGVEGGQTAGGNAEQLRESNPDNLAGQYLQLGAGAITGLIGRGASKVPGFGDVQTAAQLAIAGPKGAGSKLMATGGVTKQLLKSGFSEGVLQELPQSYQEQIWQNLAEGKPWDEGALTQGVQGAMTGMAMGVGEGAISHHGSKSEALPAVAPEQVDASNQANAEFASAQDLQDQNVAPTAGATTSVPITNPVTGQIRELDRRTGPLSSAAVDAVETGATAAAQSIDSGDLLQAHATKRAAQDYIDQQADPEMYKAVPHPRVDGRFAAVPLAGMEKGNLLAKRNAKAESESRAAQLNEEETDGAPTAQAQQAKEEGPKVPDAGELAGQEEATTNALESERAQAELATAEAQPVTDMPGVQQRTAARAASARASAEVRTQQLVDEETPTTSHAAPATIDQAVREKSTEPTAGQTTAGNYAKDHVRIGGIPLSIENVVGSVRKGVEAGKPWTTKLKAHYGYIKGSVSGDGSHMDAYVKSGTPLDHTGDVHVVDQYNPDSGHFDEHKVFFGYASADEATKAYDAHFGDKSGPKRRGALTTMTNEAFKTWLKTGDTRGAVAGTKFAGETTDAGVAAQEEIAQSTGARLSPRRDGETQEQYHQRRADETNAKRGRMQTAQGLPTRAKDEAAIRSAIELNDAQPVTLHTAGALRDAGATKGVSKQAAQFIETVARTFKKRVVFYSTVDGAAEGFYNQGNAIYINAAASTAHLKTLGHELTHAMQTEAKDAFDKMLGAVSHLLTDEELAAQYKDYFREDLDDLALLDKPYRDTDQTLREMLAEEWMADLSGNRFGEPEFWTSVFTQLESQYGDAGAKSIVGKVRQALLNALNKLLVLVKGNSFAVDERMGEHLDEIRRAVADGFAEYARAAKAGQLGERAAGGIKFGKTSEPKLERFSPVSGSRERGKDIALESRADSAVPVHPSLIRPVRDIQSVVDKFKSEFKGVPALNIRVVSTVNDIPAQFRPSPFAEGVFHDDAGLIYLVADNMLAKDGVANTERALQVLLHETVGHYGLAKMMGDRFVGVLKAVMRVARDPGVKDDIYEPGDAQYATVEAVRLRYPEASGIDVAQEVLARMAETDPGSKKLNYIRAIVRQWLRDMARAVGIDLKVTNDELNDLIVKASAFMRTGKNLENNAEPSGLVAASNKSIESKGSLARGLEPSGHVIRDPDAFELTPFDSVFGKLQKSVVENRALPSGELNGTAWKRLMPKLMPEIDVSHLQDDQSYYKSQLVQRPAKKSPMRLASEWREQSSNDIGPVYQGNGFALKAVRKFNTETDFTKFGLPWGHNAQVQGDAYRFAIQDNAGVAGFVDAEVNGLDEISAIHDMKVDNAGQGLGAKVIETIMASTYDGVRIIDVLPQSEKFWDRMGAGYLDINKNTRLDFEGSPAEARLRDRGMQARAAQGAGAGQSARFSTARFSPKGHDSYLVELRPILSDLISGNARKMSMAGARTFKVMDTPYVLQALLNDDGSKPFKQARKGLWGSGNTIASKATNTHAKSEHGTSVDSSIVINLPMLVADPEAIFTSEGGMNSKSFRILVPGAVVAIEPKTDKGFVMTIHPRNEKSVEQWARNGNLRYRNDKPPEQARSGQFATLNGGGVDLSIAQSMAESKGHNVVTKTDIDALPTAAFFSPARANLGELTSVQEAAVNRVLGVPKSLLEKAKAFKKDWAMSMRQGIFDQFAPIMAIGQVAYVRARMSKGIEATLESVMRYGMLYLNSNGTTSVRYTKAGGLQGFASKMAALKGEHDRFLTWVAALRADRLSAVGLENLMSPGDIGTLKTLNQGAMKDGTPRAMLYSQALKDLMAFNDSILKVAVDSGLIDDATRQMYKDSPYVPFYRLQDDAAPGFGVKAGMVNQTAWKKLKGGTDKLNEDLMANVLSNWAHLIDASAKNRAAKATLDGAAAMGLATQIPSGTPGKGYVSYKEGGKDKVFIVPDQHLMDAITSLETAGLGAWAKPFAAAKYWLTLGVTSAPPFKLRNLIRDSIQSIGVSDLSYNAVGNAVQGWKATAEDSETRAQMMASGAILRFGSMLDGQSSHQAKALIHKGVDSHMILDSDHAVKAFYKKYVGPAVEAYQEFGDRGEQMNRAALYEQLMAKGMSHEEASFMARDLMDFSLTGKWAAVRTLAQIVPFFNARLQGLYKLQRAGKDDYKKLAVVAGAVALASIACLLAGSGEDWWESLDDSQRNNYWFIKIAGHVLKIPKPFELGAIGSVAECGLEYMISDQMTGKRLTANMRDLVMNQLSMNPTPQLVKPLMDIYANKDSFSGRPIESMGMEKLRKEDRYDANTTEVARFLGSIGLPDPAQLAMGRWDMLSPKQVDFLTKGYFSWLGTMTTTILDYGIRPMMDRGARPTLQLKDVFFAGNFVESLPSNSSRYLTQMYDQAKTIEDAFNSYHHLLKLGDSTGAQSILAQERANIVRYPSTEAMKRAESLMNVQIQRIQASTDPAMTSEVKRERLDQIYQRRNQLAQHFRAN